MIFLPVLLFGQTRYFADQLFTATADTTSISFSPDTLDWVGYIGGTKIPSWNPITNYITVAEKGAGNSLEYIIDGETGWTWFEMVKFRIRASGDTITTAGFPIGSLVNNRVTVILEVDSTAGGKSFYTGSKVGGN